MEWPNTKMMLPLNQSQCVEEVADEALGSFDENKTNSTQRTHRQNTGRYISSNILYTHITH